MRMKKAIYIFFLLVSALIAAVYPLSAQTLPSADSLKKHVKFLASDNLKGRKAGSESDSIAAFYIQKQLSGYGLIPLFNNGIQYYSLVTDVKAGNGNTLSVNLKEYTEGRDFEPFSFSTSQSLSNEVVFAGFGITADFDSLKWDDYKDTDVNGKWVLVLRGDPEPDNPTSAFIPLASDRSKALNAKDKKAAGVLLVSPSSIDRSDKPIDITFDKSVSDAGLPVISITRKLAADILGLAESSIDSIEKVMISKKTTITINRNTTISANTDVIRQKAISRNISFMIKGSDPDLAKEYVVIGAHYDHLGMGGEGSGSRVPDTTGVHHGADDNASGVASLIELARYYSQEGNQPKRSLIFTAFGAEEMGIIGSRYFTEHTPVPLSSIKAMVNMDMVGRLNSDDESITISGTGTSNVTDSILNVLEKQVSFKIKRVPDGYGPSDHASFYTAGIPVVFISTGAHSDYHTPDDTFDKLNYQGQKKITIFTEELVKSFAGLAKPPVFAEAGTRRESGHYGRNLKVTLGIMPDVSGAETSGGMKVEGTRTGAPAEKAGMKKGDIITAINGMKVTNIYDYMSRLSKLKPGDVANVEILRDTKTEILIIQL